MPEEVDPPVSLSIRRTVLRAGVRHARHRPGRVGADRRAVARSAPGHPVSPSPTTCPAVVTAASTTSPTTAPGVRRTSSGRSCWRSPRSSMTPTRSVRSGCGCSRSRATTPSSASGFTLLRADGEGRRGLPGHLLRDRGRRGHRAAPTSRPSRSRSTRARSSWASPPACDVQRVVSGSSVRSPSRSSAGSRRASRPGPGRSRRTSSWTPPTCRQPPDYSGFGDPARGKEAALGMYDARRGRRVRGRRRLRAGGHRGGRAVRDMGHRGGRGHVPPDGRRAQAARPHLDAQERGRGHLRLRAVRRGRDVRARAPRLRARRGRRRLCHLGRVPRRRQGPGSTAGRRAS